MNELQFQREKLRRELQEIVNELDEAQTIEDDEERSRKDISAALRYMAAEYTGRKYAALVTEEVKSTKEDE